MTKGMFELNPEELSAVIGGATYNSAVNNFGGTHITNVYNRTVINNGDPGRVAFNGGTGGVRAEPTAEQRGFEHEHHVQATQAQERQVAAAREDRSLRASETPPFPIRSGPTPRTSASVPGTSTTTAPKRPSPCFVPGSAG